MKKTINCLIDHRGAPCTCDMSMYENLNKPMSKTPTQNDWEKLVDLLVDQLEQLKLDLARIRGGYPHPREQIKSLIRELLADARREVIDLIDPFDLVEDCVPDCTPVQHAYHQGTWDSYLKLEKILATLRKETK